MQSPMQQTLRLLREQGWSCEITEHWNPFARRRVDLFDCIDVLAVKGNRLLGVQTTSGSNVAARVTKIMANPRVPLLLAAGLDIHVHGWRKVKVKRGGKATRWDCRAVNVRMLFEERSRGPDLFKDSNGCATPEN